MTFEKLAALLAGEKPSRLREAARAVFRVGVASLAEADGLPAALRERLGGVPLLSLTPESLKVSADGLARKAVLRLADGLRVETVLMEPRPGRWTACLSTQVGCAMGCTFCATGLMGLARNLGSEEITDQALFWIQECRRLSLETPAAAPRVGNVVYMGMGEPFSNLEAVFESLRRLTDRAQIGLGPRRITVSTVGIAAGIERFTEAFPQVNLAVSLHSARSRTRDRIAPVNRSIGLERLAGALRRHLEGGGRKAFIEYVLLKGVNDGPEDASALASYLKSIGPPGLLHVNLIPFNPTRTPHAASGEAEAAAFARAVRAEGLRVTIRKNLGRDIDGACGQLVLQDEPVGSDGSA